MFIKAIAAGLLVVTAPGMALAHHMMDGQLPASLAAGLLSGLGHPIIGWDHLAFVVGAGVLSAVAGLGAVPILAFVLATLAGCLVHVAGADVPAAEAAIGLSLLALAAMVAWRWRARPAAAAALALAGLFHGYAYGESIVGAESTPLVAYLVGFAVIQAAIGLGVWRFLSWVEAPGTVAVARMSAVLLAAVGTLALMA